MWWAVEGSHSATGGLHPCTDYASSCEQQGLQNLQFFPTRSTKKLWYTLYAGYEKSQPTFNLLASSIKASFPLKGTALGGFTLPTTKRVPWESCDRQSLTKNYVVDPTCRFYSRLQYRIFTCHQGTTGRPCQSFGSILYVLQNIRCISNLNFQAKMRLDLSSKPLLHWVSKQHRPQQWLQSMAT